MEEVKDYSEIAMTLIAYSGEARTLAFQALDYAKKKDYQAAKAYLTKAEESSVKAHQAQTNLLIQEAQGDAIPMNVLLVHSQDHLMTSMLALELIREMVALYDTKEDRKEEAR